MKKREKKRNRKVSCLMNTPAKKKEQIDKTKTATAQFKLIGNSLLCLLLFVFFGFCFCFTRHLLRVMIHVFNIPKLFWNGLLDEQTMFDDMPFWQIIFIVSFQLVDGNAALQHFNVHTCHSQSDHFFLVVRIFEFGNCIVYQIIFHLMEIVVVGDFIHFLEFR